MRLLVDLLSHQGWPDSAPGILQVQRTPVIGADGATAVNGRYVVPTPLDVDFPITSSSYLWDGSGEIDGGDVLSQGYAHLLAQFPQYGNVYFNPLLTPDHVGELVLDRSFSFIDRSTDPPTVFYSRFQTGREAGVAGAGQMPTHTALMPANSMVTPARPGLLITDQIDIGPYTLDCDENPVGADQFMVYWKLYSFQVSHDIATDYGADAGTNTPALRTVTEVDQEPAGFQAYLSLDNGDHWTPVGLLEPVAFCDKSTSVRLAFRNNSSSKVFIASYALLF